MNIKSCERVATITQISGTCWFNAILMSIFYSDKMKELMSLKNQDWEINRGLRIIFTKMMKRNYNYSYDIPERILCKLFNDDPNNFHFNPQKQSGHYAMDYLPKLLKYLSVERILVLDCYKNKLFYSIYHSKYTYENDKLKIIDPQISYKPKYDDHDVIIIDYDSENYSYISKNKANIYKNNCNLKETIIHNNYTYKLDSLLLINFNYESCNKTHQICGITCNGIRYLYNGWIKNSSKILSSDIPKPCELIPYDWFALKGKFCLSKTQCKLNNISDIMCFDVKKGPRTYIYVKQER